VQCMICQINSPFNPIFHATIKFCSNIFAYYLHSLCTNIDYSFELDKNPILLEQALVQYLYVHYTELFFKIVVKLFYKLRFMIVQNIFNTFPSREDSIIISFYHYFLVYAQVSSFSPFRRPLPEHSSYTLNYVLFENHLEGG